MIGVMEAKPEKTYYTVPEVAEILGLEDETLRRRIQRGRFPAMKLARDWLIHRRDLERILREQGQELPGPPD